MLKVRTECTQFLPSDFTHRCVTGLESIGDEALNVGKLDEALAAYSMALSHSPKNPNTILTKWASTILIRSSPKEALGAAAKVCFTR